MGMHAWVRTPMHSTLKPQSPLVSGGQQLAQGSWRVNAEGGGEGISWKDAIESGAMTRDARMVKIRAMFDALDEDGDHIIDEEEFVQALQSEDLDAREASSLF